MRKGSKKGSKMDKKMKNKKMDNNMTNKKADWATPLDSMERENVIWIAI